MPIGSIFTGVSDIGKAIQNSAIVDAFGFTFGQLPVLREAHYVVDATLDFGYGVLDNIGGALGGVNHVPDHLEPTFPK